MEKTGEKIIKENPGMMTRYKNAHRELDKLFKRMGDKDMYFILKKRYSYLDDTGYKPEFPI